jgi:heptose I phosphotransferase
MLTKKLIKPKDSFYVDKDYEDVLRELGFCSLEAIFSYTGGKNLHKKDLPSYRNRIEITTPSCKKKLFLKRFINPPVFVQLKNFLCQKRRISLAGAELKPIFYLQKKDINVPKVAAFGQKWRNTFECKSFIITEQILDSDSLESRLPDCFYMGSQNSFERKMDFIKSLAEFVRKFHKTGFRHRDLYLCHIFYNHQDNIFTLIDLARVFKPLLLSKRYLVKDLAQLFYSSPFEYVSKSDRLRFYLYYTGRGKLSLKDKKFISRVLKKVNEMANHDEKHSKKAPFKS